MNNDWIPCSERLPEAGSPILLANAKEPSGEISIGEMMSDGSWYVEEYGYNYRATHWMPLPEKPFDAVSQADAIPTLPTLPTLPEILGSMTPEQREKARSDILEKFDRLLPHNSLLDDLKFVEVKP